MDAEQRTKTIATTPEETVTLFTALLNEADIEGMMEFYDEEATFSPQEGALVSGAADIREALEGFTAMQPVVTCKVVWVQQVGDLALVLNDHTLEGRLPDGEVLKMQGRSTDVVRRGADGGWRFFIDCVWGGGTR